MEYSQINNFLNSLVPERPDEMRLMEEFASRTSFPIIGPVCGYLCYQLTRIVNARTVFEMGSGFGYSTAWFARAVLENGGGKVHHVVWDAELSQRARGHLEKLGYTDIVEYHVAEAIETLQQSPGTFDLIFNDIDKECYPESLPLVHEKLRAGGLLIVDNLLWSGRVFDVQVDDPGTQGVRELTRHLTTDPGWISSLIPIRDGLMISFRAQD